MGFKERLKGLKESLSTGPMDVDLPDYGSPQAPARLAAGGTGTVEVTVTGENDGTVERIELSLHVSPYYETFPLADVPVRAGVHPVQVRLPAEIPPSITVYADYSLRAKIHRNKGLETEASLPIDVIGSPDHLHWPKERSGHEGADEVRVTIDLDREVVDNGTPITGRVALTAERDAGANDVVLSLTGRVVSPREPNGKDLFSREVKLAIGAAVSAGRTEAFPFSIDIPHAAPPTFAKNDTTVVWTLRASHGRAVGWRVVGVLDPKAEAGIPSRKSTGLSGLMTGSPDV